MTPTPIPDLETAQRALIDELIPGATVRRITWSEGETQVIESGTGPPLLFVHGGFSQATEWLNLWPHITASYRFVAVDRPGHGAADPYDYRGIDTRHVAARFLSDVIDSLGVDRVPVVASSMGTTWTLELAFRAPERLTKIVSIGAPAGSKARLPGPLLAMRWPFTRPMMKRVFRQSDVKSVRDFFGRILVVHPERVPEALLVAQAAGQRRSYRSILSFATAALTWGGLNHDLLLAGRWKDLKVPVHFVWGDADKFDSPDAGRAAMRDIPTDTDLTVIKDAGHLPWMDDPHGVAGAIDKALATA